MPKRGEKFPDDWKKFYTLFIHPKSKNSEKCIKVIKASMFRDQVNIINIANIPVHKLPSFIKGVPILANHKTRKLHKGADCMFTIQQLCKDNKMFNAPTNVTDSYCAFDNNKERICTKYQPLEFSQTFNKDSYESRANKAGISDIDTYKKLRDQRTDMMMKKQELYGKVQMGDIGSDNVFGAHKKK